MLYIKKGKPPQGFIQYQKTPGADFDGVDKEELRRSLLEEQGYLCAYCMKRIENNGKSTKIEHYVCRDKQNELQYSNLLAVCNGGEGAPFDNQTCDTHKQDEKLHINPQREKDIETIYYTADGMIHSQNKVHDRDLDVVLNLNNPYSGLPSCRKAALTEFHRWLKMRLGDKEATERTLRNKLAFFQEKQSGKYRPYCGIVIYYLKKRLKQIVG